MSSIDLSPIVDSLSIINRNLSVVNGNLDTLDQKVVTLANDHVHTRTLLERLYDEFAAFVEADRKQKERQFAATRLIEVRQSLEKEFGQFAVVRRTATGILQATDVALVRDETMRSVTENLMLTTPGYWLAPALVALAGWLSDNRPLAERAVAESMRRDDSKTSLFFSIVARRAGRAEATARWLRRYFQIQSPFQMEREVVLMLDAMANGVFGGSALAECSAVIEQWIVELEQQAGFAVEQRKRWLERIDVMAPHVGSDEFPMLRRNCPTWSGLKLALSRARRHGVLKAYFVDLFTGEIVVPPALETAVDGLLESLVANFDEQEIPLRREERLLQLIVEEMGDKDAAQRRMDAETEVFAEKTDFAALLTNAAMNPEQSGATRATQRYGVSRSRSWIKAAHEDLVVRDRNEVPVAVDLKAGSWSGSAKDGSEEEALVRSVEEHFEESMAEELKKHVVSGGIVVGALALGVIGLLMLKLAVLFGVVLLVAAVAFFLVKQNEAKAERERVREEFTRDRDVAMKLMRGCLAELTDVRREISAQDACATELSQFLDSLSTPQFVIQRPETIRATAV